MRLNKVEERNIELDERNKELVQRVGALEIDVKKIKH